MRNETEQMLAERKRAEEVLASEAKWRSLVENVPEVIMTVARDGTILFINHTVPGIQPEEVLGRRVYEFMPEEYDAVVRERIEQVFATGEAAGYDTRSLEAYGSRWYTSRVGPVMQEGQVVAVTLIATDITEHKRLEEAVRASEEKWRSLVENAPEVIMSVDRDGTILFINQTVSGIGAEEVIGRRIYEFMREEYHDTVRGNVERVFETGESARYDTRSLEAHGSRWYATRVGPVVQDGQVVAAIHIATDITERRRMEDSLRKAREELEQRVAERTAELAEANEALQREQRILRQLLRSHDRDRQLMAYEIHDGLAQELAGAQMRLQAFEQLKDHDAEEASKLFQAGAALLADGISEARQLISGLRPPILDESGILAAIDHLVHDTRAEQVTEIEFVGSLKSDRLEPLLENTIFRIVQEGLTNARQHSNSDKVRLELDQQGDSVRIEIRDWGIGFDPDNIADGCFGLKGIRERARLFGGRATVESTPGEGTRIVVELPVVGE